MTAGTTPVCLDLNSRQALEVPTLLKVGITGSCTDVYLQGICDLKPVIQPVIAVLLGAAQATAGNGMQSGDSLHCSLLLFLSHLRVLFCLKSDIVMLICSSGPLQLAT